LYGRTSRMSRAMHLSLRRTGRLSFSWTMLFSLVWMVYFQVSINNLGFGSSGHAHGTPATVDATFYASSLQDPPVKQADLIIPLSTMKPNEGNHASVPPGFSVRTSTLQCSSLTPSCDQVNVTLPQNSVQVYAELHASGNANEEFWVGGQSSGLPSRNALMLSHST
jgi:hypothetical protein